MDFFEVVNNRRSVRRFDKEAAIPQDDLNKILETAIKAPSAGNRQSWDFIIVTKQEIKKELVRAALGQTFIARAPVVVVVCANQVRSGGVYGRRGVNLYCIQDSAAAIQTMLLTITALGYSACWVGAFDEVAVSKILKIPEESGVRPISIIPIGVPKRIPNPTPRLSLKELIHRETW
jgi:nitroreductase